MRVDNHGMKIDFVIAWGGEDQERLNQRVRYLNQQRVQKGDQTFDIRDVRYRDWDNLHFWFRCVEMYAPWVHRIHLVTCGIVPEWLNVAHPKLNIVKHSDYIPAEYLPTFSSHPIELNLHRIPGLAEHFVYFNDDFFLTAPVQPEDFFIKGLPCDSLSEIPMQCGQDNVWNHVRMNDMALINRLFSRKQLRKQNFKKWFSLYSPKDFAKNLLFAVIPWDSFFGFTIHHLPQSYLKETFYKLWELEPDILHQTCTHRFRDSRDVSQCVFSRYQLLTWNFHPYDFYKNGKVLGGCWDPHEAAQLIANRRYKMLCINDSESLDFKSAKEIVNKAFEAALPEKSMFEK